MGLRFVSLALLVCAASGTNTTADPTCLERVNYWRAKSKLPALVGYPAMDSCAAGQAAYDVKHGAHAEFGKCDEMAQCEGNGYATCKDCIDAYYNEVGAIYQMDAARN